MAKLRRSGLLAAVVLLLVATSRLLRLNELPLNPDEIWSAWQTLGAPADIVRWTPYDWPPGYYLALGAWRSLTSLHPQVLRLLSALAFLLGAAFVFRIGRRWRGPAAGALAALAYAALGYAVLLSIEVRGYALLLALGPLALWLTERYFTHPTWQQALPLALGLAAMHYVSLTSAGLVAVLLLFTLIAYGRQVWRWWLPGALAALAALPEIISKASIAVSRVEATATLTTPPLLAALAGLFQDYAGTGVTVWAALLAVATALLAVHSRARSRQALGLLVWVLVMPALLYLLNPVLGFFSARYAWWVMIGLALWVGWGLSYLPRIGVAAAGTALAALAFLPLPVERYVIFDNPSPLGANFTWLRDHLQQGDVFILDPSSACGGPEEWDYYTRLHFPNGLAFVSQPGDHRRIWHILFDQRQNQAVQQALDPNFIHRGLFVGPPGCLFRLYEGPPDRSGIPFANGMRFHGVDVIENGLPRSGPLVRREGEPLRLRLWWSVDRLPARDYSVGVYVLAGGALLAESNSPPQLVYPLGAPVETSQWTGGGFFVEERELALPYPLWRGTFPVYMAVYTWDDLKRVSAPGQTDDLLLPLLDVYVMAY
ncbi:MAG: glycosyltransferase family 39 protein [Aggregatilineales bacterium]